MRVWPKVFEDHRKALLGVEGLLQREDTVTHLIAHRLIDLSHHLAALGELDCDSEAFALSLARADEVRRAAPETRRRGRHVQRPELQVRGGHLTLERTQR